MPRFWQNVDVSMAEKRSICKFSSTPETNYFMSKGQSHVHCPCEMCEDRAVYPMVAWRHVQKRVRYSDVSITLVRSTNHCPNEIPILVHLCVKCCLNLEYHWYLIGTCVQ